jgi:hypothetical protein
MIRRIGRSNVGTVEGAAFRSRNLAHNIRAFQHSVCLSLINVDHSVVEGSVVTASALVSVLIACPKCKGTVIEEEGRTATHILEKSCRLLHLECLEIFTGTVIAMGEIARRSAPQMCRTISKMQRNMPQMAHVLMRADLSVTICFQGLNLIWKIGDRPARSRLSTANERAGAECFGLFIVNRLERLNRDSTRFDRDNTIGTASGYRLHLDCGGC